MPGMLAVAAADGTQSATEVIAIVKEVMSLFSEFPLNILLMAGIAVVGFKVFRAGKKSAA